MSSLLSMLALLLALVVVHELAHAVAARSCGVPIRGAGLGIPLPPMLVWHNVPRLRVDLSISPWLVMAFVKPDEDALDKLLERDFRSWAWILNSGVIINFVLGCGLLSLGSAVTGNWLAAGVCAGAAVGCWFFRRFMAVYMVPLLAIPAMVLAVVALVSAWGSGDSGVGFAELGDIAPTTGLSGWIEVAAVGSISLGAINTLPLFGLDNGKVIGQWLRRWRMPSLLISVYEMVGICIVVALLVGSMVSDAVKVVF